MISLADAIIEGNYTRVADMIERGEDVNEIDAYGFTPLIESAIKNHTEIARLLIQKGALINETDVVGNTALHWAVDNYNLPLTELLLESGADPNACNRGGMPVMVKPVLRGHDEVKKMLYRYDGDLHFAQDYINAKLIGHRFELRFDVHVATPGDRFILIDFEGFYLESSLVIIEHSLRMYRRNFAAKKLRHYFTYIKAIMASLNNAAELAKFQHYVIDIEQYRNRIDKLFEHPLLIIPVAYEGHAITFIRYRNLFVKCDRGANSKFEASVMVYYLHNPNKLTKSLLYQLVYRKNSQQFVHKEINLLLGLKPIDSLPLPSQKTGNCSWANVEAAVPAAIFLLMASKSQSADDIPDIKDIAMHFYREWREWDKDRGLTECIAGFEKGREARKASKASMMATVLLQSCYHKNRRDMERAARIARVLSSPPYDMAIENYSKIYYKQRKTALGDNLVKVLRQVAPEKQGIWY